jgi:hypothetical protein
MSDKESDLTEDDGISGISDFDGSGSEDGASDSGDEQSSSRKGKGKAVAKPHSKASQDSTRKRKRDGKTGVGEMLPEPTRAEQSISELRSKSSTNFCVCMCSGANHTLSEQLFEGEIRLDAVYQRGS